MGGREGRNRARLIVYIYVSGYMIISFPQSWLQDSTRLCSP